MEVYRSDNQLLEYPILRPPPPALHVTKNSALPFTLIEATSPLHLYQSESAALTLRGSHGLSAQRVRRMKSSRPDRAAS